VELTCPSCGSPDVRSVPHIWKEIMSGAQPSSAVLEAGLAQAHVGRKAALELSDQRQRSLLAQELAPPQKQPDLPGGGSCRQMLTGILMIGVGLAAVVAGVFQLLSQHLTMGQIVGTLLGCLLVATAGYTIFRLGAPRPTFREYADRLMAWGCMYLCLKCGNRFAQDV
jgi:hypothetical protein